MNLLKITVAFFLFLPLACTTRGSRQTPPVTVGAEMLIDKHLDELKGKRVGLVMNPTARVDGTHMLDTLLSRNVNVTALFAPEHGFRGESGAGEVIKKGVDQATGLPVYSLYGETTKPAGEMLRDVDILLFDMQDVGARFYTYNVTMGLVLEAAAEHDIPFWVLDRPNPAGGHYVAGWILNEQYESFVGAYPIPMVHGMTLGELAKMMVGERWIEFDEKPELRVIPMNGWKRSMKWPETGLEWFPPSPNLPGFEHAYVYLGTVLFEATNLSEGRGTDNPFLTLGSPSTHIPDAQLGQLRRQFPAIGIERITFTPRSIPGKALRPRYEGEECYGVRLHVSDYDKLDPVAFGVALLDVILDNTGGSETTDYIYSLAGSEAVDSFAGNWTEEVEAFKKIRAKYLIYD